MNPIARLDHRFVWHPFTQMRDWQRREPIVIVAGEGARLRDTRGREYLDANASIWTNLHGHRHPRLDAAVRAQLGKLAHCSALGLANEPAARLAAELVEAANPRPARRGRARPAASEGAVPGPAAGAPLRKVFFSDDGSTAMEVALKLAHEVARRRGGHARSRFLSLDQAYHGDTVGAVSLGHIDLFHGAYAPLLFKTDRVMAPYCYRCPFNRAKPERAEARTYRRCGWECVEAVAAQFAHQARGRRGGRGGPDLAPGGGYTAFAIEPGLQGAAGMIPQPAGWLARVAEIARGYHTPLIADEVMTGFGRACPVGTATARAGDAPPLFASHVEGVQPEYLVLAKGLTGGYLPMGATLTTEAVFAAFLGEYAEFKTFFHGHSYTANPLGAAVARASLAELRSPASVQARARLERALAEGCAGLWKWPQVGDVRQVGLAVGVELVRDWRTRAPFELQAQAGIRVGEAMARRGVLTRPIGNVVVVMPPYCATPDEVGRMFAALGQAIRSVLG